jgi:anti-sigma factor RsiW
MTERCPDVVPLLGPLIDDELPLADRTWVEEHLKACESCGARRALLQAQGTSLRERMREKARDADLSRLADQVLARIAAERPVPLAERVRLWLRETFGAHRLAFGASAGLAAAAALLVAVVGRPASQRSDGRPIELASAAQGTQSEAQIEALDVYGQEGTVLQFPGQTVIWVEDEPARPGRTQ